MNEYWLIGLLLGLMIMACLAAVYPLRRQGGLSFVFIALSMTLISLGYWQWGAFSDWQHYRQQLEHQKKLTALMQSAKGPDAIIRRMEAKLQTEPDSAKGWYLLARLYSSQAKWQQASNAFETAYRLEPENEAYKVYYAQGLWQLNHQQFNDQIRGLFHSLLNKNPNQPDALAMLAMDAFMSHAYNDAINYWQRLLEMTPANSEEALALRKAIAQAQQHMDQGRNHDRKSI